MGVAEDLLPLEHRLVIGLRHVRRLGQALDRREIRPDPLPVGMLGRVGVLELRVVDDPALGGVHQEDPPGVQPLLQEHAIRRDVEHTHLGGHHHHAVLGDVVARRAQAVAVEHRADHGAVGEGDGGRPVPRLHQAAVILVEGLRLLAHRLVPAPGLRDHHEHGQGQRPARHHQELEHVVEDRRVAAALDHDGHDLPEVVPQERGVAERLARPHPVDVAAQGVDLAVVGHEPVGVREGPRRERVGGEPLVHQRQRRLHQGIHDVGEHALDLVGREHALVDEGVGGEARQVEVLPLADLAVAHRVLRPLADDVELALERGPIGHRGSAGDEHLLDHRLHRARGGADRGGVGGDGPPAEDRLALVDHEPLQDGPARLAVRRGAGQEHEAGPVAALRGQGDAEPGALALEEPVRHLDQDAGAVARVHLAATGAAVQEVLQHREGLAHDRVGLAALDVHHEADPAGVVLVGRVVEALRRGQSRVRRRRPRWLVRHVVSLRPASSPGPRAVSAAPRPNLSRETTRKRNISQARSEKTRH